MRLFVKPMPSKTDVILWEPFSKQLASLPTNPDTGCVGLGAQWNTGINALFHVPTGTIATFAASLPSLLASSASSLILPLPPCCLLLLLSSLSSPNISLLPPPSPLGSTTSSTSTLLLARYDRVVLGRVVVDEALRLLREWVRLVLVWDL